MKTITFLRHAKSDWETPFYSDKERGLSARGIKNIHSLQKLLLKREFFVNLAYISDSNRTVKTYNLLTENHKICKEKIVHPSLYEAEGKVYIDFIQKTSDEHQAILFVGHNPGMEEVINSLLGIVYGSIFTKFPTLGFCTLQFNTTNWNDIPENSKGTISFFWTPRER